MTSRKNSYTSLAVPFGGMRLTDFTPDQSTSHLSLYTGAGVNKADELYEIVSYRLALPGNAQEK